jgi:hypothetical protein
LYKIIRSQTWKTYLKLDGKNIYYYQKVILDESVSRFHALITFSDKNFYIEDLGSLTGTFIKGKNNK